MSTNATNISLASPVTSGLVSPVTLYLSWSSLGRFMSLLTLACIAIGFNGIFVAMFFVEASLKKVGNVFVCCLGLSELVNVSVVLVTAFIVLVSQQRDEMPACHMIQFVVTAANYAFILFSMLIAAEVYIRLLLSPNIARQVFTSYRVGIASVLVVITSTTVSAVGCYYQLFFDYCERKHTGNIAFRISAFILLYFIPCVVTLFFLISSACHVSSRARLIHYRRSWQYDRDRSEVALNIKMYIIFLITWTPYVIIIYQNPHVNDLTFYNFAWLGYMRSVLSGLLYNICHRTYRQAFTRVISYACCKISLNSRQQRGMQGNLSGYDVRVHIMHQAINANSPQRGQIVAREAMEL